jgi:hypothetical protein
MTALYSLDRQAQVLEHVLGYRRNDERKQLRSTQPAVDHFTITLARQAGVPAAEVAHEIGQRLGWAVYDRELIPLLAKQLGVSAAVIEQIDEKPQSWLVDCLEAFSTGGGRLTQQRYFHGLLRIVRLLGEAGRCVIVGHGAGFMLPSRTTLGVRLVASPEDRIAALGRELHLDRSSAARRMEQLQRERSRFLRGHFLVDPAKARSYDLVLNASQWSVADCADFIINALHHKAAEAQAEGERGT